MKTLVLLLPLLISFKAFGHAHLGALSHAPIGVMGDHTHKKGEIMIGARVMQMKKSGMRSGTNSINDNQYSETMKPQEMTMQMAMVGVMIGLSDRFTLVPGLSFVKKEMEMKNGMTGMTMGNESDGIGDSRLTLLFDALPKAEHTVLVLKSSLSLPTGDIDVRNSSGRLPYGIQLGSGTYDLTLGATLKHYINMIEVGGQIQGTYRVGDNDNGYTLGNVAQISVWGAYGWSRMVSSSLRLQGMWQDKIDGRDTGLTIMPSMNPAASTLNYGGTTADLMVGTNFMFDGELATDHRIALEFGIPIYQNLHGKQLEGDYKFILGYQKLF